VRHQVTVTVAHRVWVDGTDPMECLEYAKQCYTLLEHHDPQDRLDDASEEVVFAGVRQLDPRFDPNYGPSANKVIPFDRRADVP